jgi:predicted nucleic acid-binding protein
MGAEIFIDTSGFYALLVRGDDQHERAVDVTRQAAERKGRFVTTDYVLDETATLFMARGYAKLLPSFFESVFQSRACRLVWMDADRFEKTKHTFLKNVKRRWSFTDCMSFGVMRELRLREALTKDAHFMAAGFTALLT